MNGDTAAVLLVDPVRVGAGFKAAAREMGFAVVSLYTLDPGKLLADFPGHAAGDDMSIYGSDPGAVLDGLREVDMTISAIVPATEAGVYLADVMACRLGLPGNAPELAWARRNKAAMRAHAQAAGIQIPAFHRITDPADLPAAAEEIGYPVILKPTMGSQASGVTLLPTPADIARFHIGSERDACGRPVTEWLVEQYIRGREFAVNTLSFDGDHCILDIWNYRQPDSSDYDFPIWNNIQIDRTDYDRPRVEKYVRQVLTAFGITRGPCHTEVKCNQDGVYLMEIGARLPGGPATEQWLRYSNIRPFHDTLACYLGSRPDIMDGLTGFRARLGAVAIRNEDRPGTLTAVHGVDALADRPGIDRVLVAYQPGDHVPVTRELATIPVGAWVSGPDEEHVLNIMAAFRSAVTLDITPDPVDDEHG